MVSLGGLGDIIIRMLLIGLALAVGVDGVFYLPGVAPQTQTERVKLFVNKLTSTHTQIPYTQPPRFLSCT
jgi:hypothetical protein